MAGLYVHIPFCRSRCIYCGFYSTVALEQRQRYVDAVCREMEAHPFPLPEGMGIDTIYLGGGTPSQLTPEQLHQLFIYINKVYAPLSLQGGAGGGPEVTIEVNPDDVTVEYAAGLQQLPINRISMGIQTFDDDRLRFLHRRHTAAQARQAVATLRAAGFHNISIDLMYGFPGETLNDWQRDVDAAIALDVEHISAYCLTLEEGTVLFEQMRNEKLEMRNGNEAMSNEEAEEQERQMYELLMDKLVAAGYEHYEISNFAKQGYRSRHNSSYWHDEPYIGLGAAAHSYHSPLQSEGVGGRLFACRSWNVANIHSYMDAIEQGRIPCEQEVLDDDTHYNDRITTALRTREGLDLSTLSDKHRDYCQHEAQPFLNDGLLSLDGNHLHLTRKGLFVSDYIMSSLVYV